MSLWFECKVRFDKTMENGSIKKVTEAYLVDAVSFTEAEQRITEEMRPFMSGDFSIPAIKKTNIAEIFYDDSCDKWWHVKYNIITIDEKSAKERRTAVHTMVSAHTQQGATDRFNEGMKDTLSDFEIEKVAETKIMDVYPYKSNGISTSSMTVDPEQPYGKVN